MIYDRLKVRIDADPAQTISCRTRIHMVDDRRHKFMEVGSGTVTLIR